MVILLTIPVTCIVISLIIRVIVTVLLKVGVIDLRGDANKIQWVYLLQQVMKISAPIMFPRVRPRPYIVLWCVNKSVSFALIYTCGFDVMFRRFMERRCRQQ